MNFDTVSGETADLEYFWESITMDDVATPGSFWLNPPLPKDDEGNGVNVYSIIESYGDTVEEKEQPEEKVSSTAASEDIPSSVDDDDEYLDSILLDIDPL